MSAESHPLIHLLPAVYQRTLQDPKLPNRILLALLDVITELQSPDQEMLAELDTYFDRYQAPDAFVPLLACWLDLDWLYTHLPARLDEAALPENSHLEIGRLRELIAAATRFARLRGTAQGLLDFMETATGVHGLAVNDHVPGRSFHLQVWVPPQGEPQRALLARMLRVLKPAYTTAELLLFTAENLANKLPKEFNLSRLVVQTDVLESDPRPRRIILRVIAPPDADLESDKRLKVADKIDELTPPGKDTPAVTFVEEDVRVWKKTFREWPNP